MKKNGFTLVEAIVAMAVGALIMAAVYGYMTLVQKNSANADRKIVTQQDTRMVLDLMATEIRMASYNPRDIAHIWSDAPALTGNYSCGGALSNICTTALCKGIKIATRDNSTKREVLAVAMDLDSSGRIGDGNNEYIVYSYDGTSTLTRSVNCGTAQSILGGDAPYTNVRNADAAANVRMFRYFDAANTEITNTVISSPTSTINGIPAIRRILITIVADTAEKDVNTHQYKRMVYSTSVIVRNHGFAY